MPESSAFPKFQDRDYELDAICAVRSSIRVLNFHGEAGIGKSRLLDEGAAILRNRHGALVVRVDLEALAQQQGGRPLEFLRLMAEEMPELGPVTGDANDAAGLVVERLNSIPEKRPVVLMIDTTEKLQDPTFWQWFEKHVLSPLVGEGSVRVVLAGRLPAPIRLVEVRRHLKVWPLEPLPIEDEARKLVQEVLKTAAQPVPPARLEELTDLVLVFSGGHPKLAAEIAGYLAGSAQQGPSNSLLRRIADEVVGPFIDEELFPFDAEIAPWRPVLKWASVLDWFDASVLYRFCVAMSDLTIPETEWQHEFVKAMARLRSPYAVVEWRDMGYTLVGAIKSIVASYMRFARHDEYLRALGAAAAILERVSDEYFSDNPQAAEPYRHAARIYENRRELEVQHGTAEQP